MSGSGEGETGAHRRVRRGSTNKIFGIGRRDLRRVRAARSVVVVAGQGGEPLFTLLRVSEDPVPVRDAYFVRPPVPALGLVAGSGGGLQGELVELLAGRRRVVASDARPAEALLLDSD